MRISDWSSDVCSSDLTDVESTHRKLRARLTDGLGGNDTHGFAVVDQVAPAQIAAIAMRAQTMTRFAGQRRTYLDLVDADAIDELDQIFVQQGAGPASCFLRIGINDIHRRDTNQNAIGRPVCREREC